MQNQPSQSQDKGTTDKRLADIAKNTKDEGMKEAIKDRIKNKDVKK